MVTKCLLMAVILSASLSASSGAWFLLGESGEVEISAARPSADEKSPMPVAGAVKTGPNSNALLIAPKTATVTVGSESVFSTEPEATIRSGAVGVAVMEGKSMLLSVTGIEKPLVIRGEVWLGLGGGTPAFCLAAGSSVDDGSTVFKGEKDKTACYSATGLSVEEGSASSIWRPSNIKLSDFWTEQEQSPSGLAAPFPIEEPPLLDTEAGEGSMAGSRGEASKGEKTSSSESLCLDSSGPEGSAGEINGDSHGVEIERKSATVRVRVNFGEKK